MLRGMSIADDRARRAARSLSRLAAAVLIFLTVVLAAAFVLGLGVAIIGDTKGERWFGMGLAVGAPVTWALAALPCVGAAAVARYIEARADEITPGAPADRLR